MEKTPPGLVETLGFGLKPPGSHLRQTRGYVYLYQSPQLFKDDSSKGEIKVRRF